MRWAPSPTNDGIISQTKDIDEIYYLVGFKTLEEFWTNYRKLKGTKIRNKIFFVVKATFDFQKVTAILTHLSISASSV